MFGEFPRCRHIRDGVSLSAACRTISEDGGIVAVEDAVEEVLCGGFVDFGLCCVVVKDAIEGEGLILGSLSSHAWSHASLCRRVFWVEDSGELVSALRSNVLMYGHTSISHP